MIAEIGMEPADFIERSSDRTLEQVANPTLQDLVGRQPDRIFDPLGFQELVDVERRLHRLRCALRPGNVHSAAGSHARRPRPGIVLDMDSSVSSTHGEQEMSGWNGHYESRRPLPKSTGHPGKAG